MQISVLWTSLWGFSLCFLLVVALHKIHKSDTKLWETDMSGLIFRSRAKLLFELEFHVRKFQSQISLCLSFYL